MKTIPFKVWRSDAAKKLGISEVTVEYRIAVGIIPKPKFVKGHMNGLAIVLPAPDLSNQAIKPGEMWLKAWIAMKADEMGKTFKAAYADYARKIIKPSSIRRITCKTIVVKP